MKALRALPLFLLLCGHWVPAQAAWYRVEDALMGTRVSVELWSPDEAAAQAAAEAVMAEYRRIDRLMSTYIDESEISAVNRAAAEGPVVVSRELAELVQRALQLSRMSDGAFDITYDSIGHLYDYRAGKAPDQRQIDSLLPDVDWHYVKVNPQVPSIRFLHPGVRINLGGIAKGYAVERAAAVLRGRGIRYALLNAGGDSRMLGDRRGKPWIVGIRDPRREDGVVTRVPLVDEAISTSGDYERFFERDGVRYHHILDPGTGHSAAEVESVTVIGPDAAMTDGLSTTVFVLGVDKGLRLIASLPQYEAIVVDARGSLFYSSGLMPPGDSR